MSKYRKVRDTRDANHAVIVRYLRVCGIEVIETERPLDCLIFNGHGSGWIEIKTEARNTNIKRGQLEFMSSTEMPVQLVKSEAQALDFALDLQGWTDEQKDAIAQLLIRNATKAKFDPAEIEDALGIYTGRKRPNASLAGKAR